jgi:predicted dehydrogenase
MSPYAPIAYVCDTYTDPRFEKKWKEIAPAAKYAPDYKQVLDDKTVQAVFIATPSHKHKQIALDAISAGKHVYCEAPLATDIGEAKDIAKAAISAKTVFQPGLQQRSNAQTLHVLKFIKSKALGKMTSGRAQHHQRNSWRQAWPAQERADELNWRLSKSTSSGLLGEVGIHQMDMASWFINALPTSVEGYGAIMEYQDGRDVYDTVQCLFEYPKNMRFLYDASLSSAYEGAYELFLGTQASIQTRDLRAWMFKETDAPILGWEGFARQDVLSIGDLTTGTGLKIGTGIALVADASKQVALYGKTKGTDLSKTSLYQSINKFLNAIRDNTRPPVGALEGYQATVVAVKANEAVMTGSKIVFEKEWFEI